MNNVALFFSILASMGTLLAIQTTLLVALMNARFRPIEEDTRLIKDHLIGAGIGTLRK